MNNPKVSVIVPIYNVSKFIERCARSLFEQTLNDIEYIFVDDCSPDDSIEILKRVLLDYPSRKECVSIIRHPVNKGLAEARNSGLSIATGEYIAHCDSDDYVAKEMYESLYNKAKKDDAEIVFCDFNFAYLDRIIRYYAARPIDDHTAFVQSFIASSWTVVWNFIAQKDLYQIHHLHSPVGITYGEDFFLSVRLVHFAQRISIVEKPLYYYNQENNGSIMRSRNRASELSERKVYLDTIDFFKREGMLNQYERELSWRVLRNKQDLVLDPASFEDFLNIYPESHKYILSCPTRFCNRKIKILMWMLTHRMKYLAKSIDCIREALGR